jgi:hypothetical protein
MVTGAGLVDAAEVVWLVVDVCPELLVCAQTVLQSSSTPAAEVMFRSIPTSLPMVRFNGARISRDEIGYARHVQRA